MTFLSNTILKIGRRCWKSTGDNIHTSFSYCLHNQYSKFCNIIYSSKKFLNSRSVCVLSAHTYCSQSPPTFTSHVCLKVTPSDNDYRVHSTFSLRKIQHIYKAERCFHHDSCRLTCSPRDESQQQLVDEILKSTKEVDVMAGSLVLDVIMNLVETLESQGFDKKRIQRLLSRRLWLLEQPDRVIEMTELLLLHGFSHSLVCQLIEAVPYDIQLSLNKITDKINNSIFFFGNQGISGTNLHSLLNTNPNVLYLDLKTVGMAVSRLKSIFSGKDVKTLLKRSPGLLATSWSDVYRKYEYAVYKMVYSDDEIVHSTFLSHSLSHIKNRHLFLVRSGLFVAVSHKLDPALNPNPKLKDVVDTSDSAFLKLFPVTNLEGYNVYCEMRALEQEMETEEEDGEFDDYASDVDDVEVDSDDSDIETVSISRENMLKATMKDSRKKNNNKNRSGFK